MIKKPTIILASASPRRKALLKRIIPYFKVIPSRIRESSIRAKSPLAFAVKAALAKALAVATKQKKALVIGADTIVVLGKKILGKPSHKQDAYRMLKLLSGKTHKVITGVALVDSESLQVRAGYEVTKIKMKKMRDGEIRKYVKSGLPLDKAGAYGIQEIEKIFIKEVAGDYNNVVGLPLSLVKRLLKLS